MAWQHASLNNPRPEQEWSSGGISSPHHNITGVPSTESTPLSYQQDYQQDAQSHHQQTTSQNIHVHVPETKDPRWPQTPTQLTSNSWATISADFTAALLSLPFLVLAIVLMRLDGVRVDERRQQYTNAILVVSIYIDPFSLLY